MHELKKHLDDIVELEGRLITIAKSELDKGKECVDTEEYGQVIDMIKDLADAKKNCMEAVYYHKVSEAMEEAEEDYPEGPMGYDRYRSGRFAPKGRGHISGFTPTMMQMPYIHDYIHDPEHFRDEMREGYSPSGQGNRSQSGSRMGGGYGRYGYTPHPIDMYRDTKRYYHETKDAEAKRRMDEHASEHVGETLTSIREIWDDADPKMRVKLKEDFQKLIRDMDNVTM